MDSNGLGQSDVIIVVNGNHNLKYLKGFEQDLFHCPVNISTARDKEL